MVYKSDGLGFKARQSLSVRTWASHLRCPRLRFLTYERGRVSDITSELLWVHWDKWDSNVMHLATVITWQVSVPFLKWKVDVSRRFLSIIENSKTIKKPCLRDLQWAVCLRNWKSQRYKRHLCFQLWRISSAMFSGKDYLASGDLVLLATVSRTGGMTLEKSLVLPLSVSSPTKQKNRSAHLSERGGQKKKRWKHSENHRATQMFMFILFSGEGLETTTL